LAHIQLPQKLEPLWKPKRYKVLHGGRGGAKSWGIASTLLLMGAEKPMRVLCAREVQKSIQDSVYRLLLDQILRMDLGAFYSSTETQIRGANGTMFLFAGIRGQSIENLKSYEGVDVCWVEEANAVTKKSWAVLIPTIRKEQSEIWISFNPDLDTDETYVRFVMKPPKDSIVIQMNWRDNPWFPEVLRKEKEHLESTDPAAFRNVWEGECRSAVDGAIYGAEVIKLIADGRYRPVPYDPMLTVHSIWDLGWNDKMAIILAQGLGGELRIIQYIEDSHLTLADYVTGLEANKYRWGFDFLPHDGAAKDYKTGKSAEEILRSLKRNPRIVPQIGIEQGIKATRLIFPRLYIDSDNASRLVDCCKRYRRAIPTSTNEPAAPLHDGYSHGADALRYLAVIANEIRNDVMSKKTLTYPKRAYV
jgi:phage terminase large subunit